MDDDEDNNQEQNDEEEQYSSLRSFSKRRYFGKCSKDVKPLSVKLNIKIPQLKSVKISVEEIMNKTIVPLQTSTYMKIKHKQQIGDFTSKSTLNLSLKNHLINSYDLSTSLKTKIEEPYEGKIDTNLKINNKGEVMGKVGHHFKIGDLLKIKVAGELEWRNGAVGYGGSWGVEKRRNSRYGWMWFGEGYNEVVGVNGSAKNNGKNKVQAFFKALTTTPQNHKLYLQHKLTYEGRINPLLTSFTANCQDSLGIGTFNATATFENSVLKSTQLRLLLQFYKSVAVGVQRKNDTYEFMFQKRKMRWGWLKCFRVNVGNRGLLSTLYGRLYVGRTGIDYGLNYKLRQIKYNFYQDSSLGFKCQFNI